MKESEFYSISCSCDHEERFHRDPDDARGCCGRNIRYGGGETCGCRAYDGRGERIAMYQYAPDDSVLQILISRDPWRFNGYRPEKVKPLLRPASVE